VVSDLFGNSGRRLLEALIAEECDPHKLAALALDTLRRQQSRLELALTGQCTMHHGRLIHRVLALMDLLDRQIVMLDEEIRDAVGPSRHGSSHPPAFRGPDTTTEVLETLGGVYSRGRIAVRLGAE
jgi:hypothetical protein